MMRRNFHSLALAMVLVPATVALVLKRLPDAPVSVLAFSKPNHRVAMAVDEALRAELATTAMGTYDFILDQGLKKPNGQLPTTGEVAIPEDYPSFWFSMKAISNKPTLVRLNRMEFDGTTRDGRKVHVAIKKDSIGKGSLVDCHGDEALARALACRIADRLAHPRYKHESAEDRAALVAFFGPKPPPAKAPGGTVDPAVPQSGGTDGLDPSSPDHHSPDRPRPEAGGSSQGGPAR